MLEQNGFRLYMAIGGIIVVSLILAMVFAYPMVELDDSSRDTYARVMDINQDIVDEKTHLTMYESIMFTIQAEPRSDVRQY